MVYTRGMVERFRNENHFFTFYRRQKSIRKKSQKNTPEVLRAYARTNFGLARIYKIKNIRKRAVFFEPAFTRNTKKASNFQKIKKSFPVAITPLVLPIQKNQNLAMGRHFKPLLF